MYYHHYGWGPGWILIAAIVVVPIWKICQRVGHSPWLSLLTLIPIVNLIFMYWLAFGDWPARSNPPAATP